MAPRKILAVDDSLTMRSMIATLLQEEGYDVTTAVDGNDGLAKSRESTFDLVLSDYEMPELDGPGFCRAFKADPDLRGIPVVMLTTLSALESKLTGLDSGADDYLVKPKTPADFRELFARIRAQLRIADLRAELADRNRLLEAAQKKLKLELDLARKVQLSLMPKAPKTSGILKLAVKYNPANELGGDVYDFVRRDDGRLGILVADISGHGAASAMLAGMIKALNSPLSASEPSPSHVLAGLDKGLEQYFPEGFFCTAFSVFLDEATGAFEFAGVGHPPALVVGPSPTRSLASEPGLLGVGMVDADSLVSGKEQLKPGESVMLYTDGLPDAMDPSDVLFGEGRIIDVLEASKSLPPAEILEQMEQTVGRHVHPGSAADDINMVVIQRPT